MTDDLDLRAGSTNQLEIDPRATSPASPPRSPRRSRGRRTILLDGDLEGRRLPDPRRRRDRRPLARASRSAATRCSRCRPRWPATCARSWPLVRMVGEIERSADLCVNICKAARRIYGHELDPRLRGIISTMGDQAQQLSPRRIDAYVDSDVATGVGHRRHGLVLDGLQRQFVEAIFESHAAERIDLQVAVQLALVGPLLRAHRRPRREHRRAGAVHDHRLAARAQGRRARYRRDTPGRRRWTSATVAAGPST